MERWQAARVWHSAGLRIAALGAALVAGACTARDRSSPGGDTASPPVAGVSGAVPHAAREGETGPAHVGPPHDTAAAQHATWDIAMLETRLRAAGFPVERAPAVVRQPFMSVPGTAFRVGRAEIQAYVYGDQVVRAIDTDKLDPRRVAPPTMMVTWQQTPSLVVDANLALIVLSDDAGLRERIRAAITGDHGRGARE